MVIVLVKTTRRQTAGFGLRSVGVCYVLIFAMYVKCKRSSSAMFIFTRFNNTKGRPAGHPQSCQ